MGPTRAHSGAVPVLWADSDIAVGVVHRSAIGEGRGTTIPILVSNLRAFSGIQEWRWLRSLIEYEHINGSCCALGSCQNHSQGAGRSFPVSGSRHNRTGS